MDAYESHSNTTAESQQRQRPFSIPTFLSSVPSLDQASNASASANAETLLNRTTDASGDFVHPEFKVASYNEDGVFEDDDEEEEEGEDGDGNMQSKQGPGSTAASDSNNASRTGREYAETVQRLVEVYESRQQQFPAVAANDINGLNVAVEENRGNESMKQHISVPTYSSFFTDSKKYPHHTLPMPEQKFILINLASFNLKTRCTEPTFRYSGSYDSMEIAAIERDEMGLAMGADSHLVTMIANAGVPVLVASTMEHMRNPSYVETKTSQVLAAFEKMIEKEKKDFEMRIRVRNAYVRVKNAKSREDTPSRDDVALLEQFQEEYLLKNRPKAASSNNGSKVQDPAELEMLKKYRDVLPPQNREKIVTSVMRRNGTAQGESTTEANADSRIESKDAGSGTGNASSVRRTTKRFDSRYTRMNFMYVVWASVPDLTSGVRKGTELPEPVIFVFAGFGTDDEAAAYAEHCIKPKFPLYDLHVTLSYEWTDALYVPSDDEVRTTYHVKEQTDLYAQRGQAKGKAASMRQEFESSRSGEPTSDVQS